MSHVCSHALVRCIDFRLGHAVHDYIHNSLCKDADIISLAGAAKGIAQTQLGIIEEQIALSKRLHKIEEVVLMNHTDCGAYGGKAAFASKEEECAKHTEDLLTAKAKIQELHPELRVRLTIAHIEDDGSIHIEEVN
jgi:carbonic anhydrase